MQDTRFLEPAKRHKNEYSLNGDGVAILVSGYEICKKASAALRSSTYQRRGLFHASFRVKCHSSGSIWGMLRGSGTWAFKKRWYKKRNEPRRGLRLR